MLAWLQQPGSGQELNIYRRSLPHWRIPPGQPDLSPQERTTVVWALRHFEGQRYRLLAYVVMNDHVHVLLQPLTGHQLAAILHSWKRHSSRQIQRQRGCSGSLWQAEYFDRIMRDDAEVLEKASYIAGNPWKRWPHLMKYSWVWEAESR